LLGELGARHVTEHPQAGGGGESGDDGDRAAVVQVIGDASCDDGAERVAHVTPEAVDADDRSARHR